MTDEIKKPAEEKAIAVRTSIEANGKGLILRSLDDMYRFGQFVVKSQLANTPEEALIKIQTGAELNIPPMKALQSVLVVKGQARLWGDMPLGLVRRSELLENIDETIEGEIGKDLSKTPDDVKAVCITKRKGEKEKTTEFSVADARRAGLWGKAGTWLTHPQRMLKYKARSFNLRDNYPDVLAGITIHEEFEGVELPDTAINEKPKSAVLLGESPEEIPPKIEVTKQEPVTKPKKEKKKPEPDADKIGIPVFTCTDTFEVSCPYKDKEMRIETDNLKPDDNGQYTCNECGSLLKLLRTD